MSAMTSRSRLVVLFSAFVALFGCSSSKAKVDAMVNQGDGASGGAGGGDAAGAGTGGRIDGPTGAAGSGGGAGGSGGAQDAPVDQGTADVSGGSDAAADGATRRCTRTQDCLAGEVCFTMNQCANGFCKAAPASCAQSGTLTCACAGQTVCGQGLTCIDQATCLLCTTPP